MKKILLACLITAFVATSAMAATVKVGLMAPLTGPWASEGQAMKQIVELLADEVNAKGGTQFEIIAEDDGGDPRTASLAAQRLSTKGIVAVVGTYGSSITEASQSIYDESEILQIATGSTAVRLTEKGMNFFMRTCPRDDEQGRVAAKAIKTNGWKKVAILHDNTSYAKGLADEAKSLLVKDGVEVVFFDALTPGERDYSAIITKMKSAGPDGVFFTGYYPEAGLLLRQKAEVKWAVPFIAGDATNNPDLVKIAGNKAAEGFMFLSPPVPQDLTSKESVDFIKAYKAKFNQDPSSIWAVIAGDAFLAIVDGIEGSKSTKSADIVKYLKSNKAGFTALTGVIKFNDKGDRIGDLYKVYKVDAAGKFKMQ
jgi:branched-chain amino acid transport system substrate-binding protein